MSPQLSEWLQLALRWAHVVAGAFWIGQTAYFSWLDAQSGPRPSGTAPGGEHDVWMVHSGGFYRVEKLTQPGRIPGKLHWFRWEAAWTWITGFLLLNLLYYHGGAMVPAGSTLSPWAAGGIGVGVLIASWVVYDLLWSSPLARRETIAIAVSLALLAVTAWGLTRVMAGRAAYIHVGALFGTIMAANVWMRILPAQRRMVASLGRDEPVDTALGERAKQRSRHNSFLTVPLVFLMVSNHYPTASYGQRLNWLLLWVFLLAGFAGRAALSAWDRRS